VQHVLVPEQVCFHQFLEATIDHGHGHLELSSVVPPTREGVRTYLLGCGETVSRDETEDFQVSLGET
jgi:hypothetical protein